ncbi:MAG: shikimate kinase [Ignavibacteriales bacterium]|jgi:shikimate kinase|nr:shikimate kinase [Ignavibacteriaceae bacterium]NLH62264.1 shikimate kinase [Ignavibacteriales bacterium]HOJ16951.1 shikimate kinase [Ignavibacteriaceae bacterium]
MSTKRIYLTGFMASGKSTLGILIANTLGWDFFDLDDFIAKNEKKQVIEIFKDSGEEYFREIETKWLLELSKTVNTIIALGGGTLFHNNNFEIVKNSGKLIYLKSSPENIYRRVKHKTNRPLLLDENFEPLSKEETLKKIRALLSEREKYYNQSDIVFIIDNRYVGKTVDLLTNLIKRKFKIS